MEEMLTLINYKHKKHVYGKQILDPRGSMILVAQNWNKIAKYLQAQTKSKLLENGKMCKDKWNSIHDDYKKISNYQKDTRNNTSYWDLLAKNQHQHHLP